MKNNLTDSIYKAWRTGILPLVTALLLLTGCEMDSDMNLPLNVDPELKVLYSDEDKMSMDGHKFFQPHFKPDFNIDLLCTVNYICHLFVVKKEIVDQIGMLKKEFDGAQDYDFVFRCVEAAGREQIHHIPRILYHWRCHEDSTAENPESKMYAFDAGARAIKAHYDRLGVPVRKDSAIAGKPPRQHPKALGSRKTAYW